MLNKFSILIIILQYSIVFSCYLHGTDSGECIEDTFTSPNYRLQFMPFCAKIVKYPACVPKQQVNKYFKSIYFKIIISKKCYLFYYNNTNR